jgi:hypothetical protein
VTSACWMVAGSWVVVGSKVAPCPGMSRMIKDVIMVRCDLIFASRTAYPVRGHRLPDGRRIPNPGPRFAPQTECRKRFFYQVYS